MAELETDRVHFGPTVQVAVLFAAIGSVVAVVTESVTDWTFWLPRRVDKRLLAGEEGFEPSIS